MADEYYDDSTDAEYPAYTLQQSTPTIYDSGDTSAGRDWYSLAQNGEINGGGSLDGGGGGVPQARLGSEFSGGAPMSYSPGTSTGGSAKSSYDNNFSVSPMSMGGGDMPMSRGTPPMPARSGGYQGPNLPPAQFQRLNQLLTNPSAISSDPGYQFLKEQGEGALARTAAAKKMTLSGNSMIDALKFGQGNAMQYLNQLIQQLLGASNASRIGVNGAVGPDAGTQGEYASRDLIPVIMKMLGGGGGGMPPVTSLPPPSYGGYRPRLQPAFNMPESAFPKFTPGYSENPQGLANEDVLQMLAESGNLE
jgi:hypothetical protein